MSSNSKSIVPVTHRIRRYVEASKAENTQRAYLTHWRDFERFCAEHGYKALPAQAAAVADYLTLLADLGAKMSTIQVKAAAISYAHRADQSDNPIKTTEVQETLRGIRRTLGTRQNGKDPLTLDELQKLIGVLPDDLRGERDKALLMIGFAGAFRRSELISLSISDITFEAKQIRINIRRSKTDQEGRGMTKVIPMIGNKMICPVTALKSWLARAGITQGVIFRPIDRWGKVHNRIMQGQEVTRVIKKYAILADLDAERVAGHSLRAGYVTEAADRDVPLWKIKQQTGHRSDNTIQRYIRDRGRGAIDATRAVFGEEP